MSSCKPCNVSPSPSYAGMTNTSPSELRQMYISLMEHGVSHPQYAKQNIRKLKDMILSFGLPPESMEESHLCIDSHSTLRGQIWQILLGIQQVDVDEYTNLVKCGPSRKHNIIKQDAMRTFPKETKLKSRVTLPKLIRILNAFQHKSDLGHTNGYIQGLNCLAAPFLYNMPEVEAFFAFYRFLIDFCPRYCGNGMGASDGDKLVQSVLQSIDPILYNHLENSSVHLYTFSHPMLQSLLTDTPPLDQIWPLWDILFAFGVHMAVIFVACLLLTRREEILNTSEPNAKFFQYHNKLTVDASFVMNLAMQVISQIPLYLYIMCVRHPLQELTEMQKTFLSKNASTMAKK